MWAMTSPLTSTGALFASALCVLTMVAATAEPLATIPSTPMEAALDALRSRFSNQQFPLSPDTYTWEFAAKIPSITLEPGKRFEQRLALEDAYQFEQPGSYTVTFSTAISILVGDENGRYADLCPIRLVAENSHMFVVSSRSQ